MSGLKIGAPLIALSAKTRFWGVQIGLHFAIDFECRLYNLGRFLEAWKAQTSSFRPEEVSGGLGDPKFKDFHSFPNRCCIIF